MKRREILDRLKSLEDLHDIFETMKNLALAEMAKLSATQHARAHLLGEMDRMRAASAAYFRNGSHAASDSEPVHILVGSERSFCGDFNERIVARWLAIAGRLREPRAIAVGGALADKLRDARCDVPALPGPAVAEDLDAVLVAVLRRMQILERAVPTPVTFVAVASTFDGTTTRPILPWSAPDSDPTRDPPELYLAPAQFVRRFVDAYVEAGLHDIFSTSLMAENRARMNHMTAALDTVDERVRDLRRRSNRLRQEEITQGIELILLSAGVH